MSVLWPHTKRSEEPESITYKSVQTHLQFYPSHIPPKLRALDALRFNEIPEKLAQRKKDGDAFLEKSEVSALVEWKLKHGTFRPNLANLVASNSDADILSTTKSAFKTYEANNDDYLDSITALSKLKGIGPATASLLLSCYDPGKVPFFSNELFRYALWRRIHGEGWDRKIKYSMKEYTEMFENAQKLRGRLEKDSGEEVSALELEKMAYVLGKEVQKGDATLYAADDSEKEEDPETHPRESKEQKNGATSKDKPSKDPTKQPPKTSKKRKPPTNKNSIQNDEPKQKVSRKKQKPSTP